MAEDALQGKDVPAICEEGSREAMAEHVWRAPRGDARGSRQAADELLDHPRSQAGASLADEERI